MLSTARLLGQSIGAALAALILAAFGDQGPTVSLKVAASAAVVAGILSLVRAF